MPCLQGYVKTTYSQLVEKLGEPTYKREGTYSNPTENDGDGNLLFTYEFDVRESL